MTAWDYSVPCRLQAWNLVVAIRLLTLGLVLSFCFPNVCQIARSFHPTLDDSQEYEQAPIGRVARFQSKLLQLIELRPTKLQGCMLWVAIFRVVSLRGKRN